MAAGCGILCVSGVMPRWTDNQAEVMEPLWYLTWAATDP
jgi:hypothetical protein